jgi:hypothetical protein
MNDVIKMNPKIMQGPSKTILKTTKTISTR